MTTRGGYHWAHTECNTRNHETVFPNLFPNTLEHLCTNSILTQLIRSGEKIEKTAKRLTEASQYNNRFAQRNRDIYEHPHRMDAQFNANIPPRQNTVTRSSSFLSQTSNNSSDFQFTKHNYFIECVEISKQFLTSFLASSVLDRLIDAARRQGNAAQDGHLFCFSVLCNDRLAQLVVCLHKEVDEKDTRNEILDNAGGIAPGRKNDEKCQNDWSNFLLDGVGSNLFLACLDQLSGLASLTIHDLATNEMLDVIADTCHRLVIIDISYSSNVSELGLVYLCGKTSLSISGVPSSNITEHHHSNNNYDIKNHSSRGCKFLRELHFNPRAQKSQPINNVTKPIMPRVIAYIFRHLVHLQLVNMENLYDGIECYYYGVPGEYHPSPSRIQPLKLVQYIGQDDQLIKIAAICPKLKAFIIKVTTEESLCRLAEKLANDFATMSLDHVTLMYDERHHQALHGFNEFVEKCGHRINSLSITSCLSQPNTANVGIAHVEEEIEEEVGTKIFLDNLAIISSKCKLLDYLCLRNLKFSSSQGTFPSQVPSTPLEFRFLTSLQLNNNSFSHCPKETLKYILGNSPDLERIHIRFDTTSFFFNDFLLDEILTLNPISKLEEFTLENGALTLISALRLFNSRPKFKSIGNLLTWDVEPSELVNFEKILRKAKGLNLLRHDVKIY